MPNLKKELPIALRYKSGEGQSGTSLFLVIIIMTIFLAIVLGLSAIFLGQMVMFRKMGYSVIALHAADAGIERVLIHRRAPSNISGSLPNGATYQVFVTFAGAPGCPHPPPPSPPLNFCIRSIGTFRDVNRAIEIVY